MQSPVAREAIRAAAGLGPFSPRHFGAGGVPAAKGKKPLIYSGNYGANTVTVFPDKGVNQPPIGEITDGISAPERLFVDNKLQLYVTNGGNNTITIYHRGAKSPSLTISNGVETPTGIVVGADGTVYCDNVLNSTITEYPKGQTSPSVTISMPGLEPENMAVDSSNNLYVLYLVIGSTGSGIMEFPSGSTSGQNLGITPGWPSALEVDRSGNIIAIVVQSSGSSIDVFPPGQTQPSKTIPVTSGLPYMLSLSKNEKKLYVSVLTASSAWIIQQLNYPNGKALTNKETSSVGGWPLAVSPDNGL